MTIDSYKYGQIVVNGTAYTSDIIVYHDRVDKVLSRHEEHRLIPADITDALNAQPDVLIIGTGYAGVLIVPKEMAAHIAAQGIEVIIEKTSKAVELYNSLLSTKKYAIAALHIAC